MAASPEWDGESVNFYVQDDQGGRLEEVYCQPATLEDIKDTLADEMQLLSALLAAGPPQRPQRANAISAPPADFRELTEDPLRTDLDNYFFRYRDANGHWRRAWCWGYQRMDEEAAPAVICTDPDCSLLFLRRPGRKNKCPACLAALLAKPRKPSHWKRNSLLALLLLLLIGAGAVLVLGSHAPVHLAGELAPRGGTGRRSENLRPGRRAGGPCQQRRGRGGGNAA